MKKPDGKTMKRVISNVAYPLAALGIVVAVWAAASAVKGSLVLPMPGPVLREFFLLLGTGTFWRAVGGTVGRTLLCFLISFSAAVLLAALSGAFEPVHRVTAPVVTILRAAPTVAVILILYAFLGNRQLAIVVGFLIAFPVLYGSFHSAVSNVDGDLVEMARIYGVKPRRIITGVYLPEIAPVLFDSSASTISLTFKVIIAAEILTLVPRSMGDGIQIANASFELVSLLAWTFAAVVLSFVLEGAVNLLKKIAEAVR